MFIEEIADLLSGTLLCKGPNLPVKHLIYDSRKSAGTTDELFIALTGSRHNGHQFIRQLYDQGVRHFLVSDHTAPLPGCNMIRVENTLHALQALASHHRAQHNLPVVGITGSNGKTIVKEWLASLLERQWHVVKSPKSFNSQLGVPLSVWEIADHEIGVFEAGISKAGEMQRLEAIIRPTIGIFTNIGEAHNEGFSSIQEKLYEKALLFRHADQVICRIDHESIVAVLTSLQKPGVITWGIDRPDAILNFQPADDGFRIEYETKSYFFATKWTNTWDVENLFHSISAAILLGEEESAIQQGIRHLKTVPMRLELKRGNFNTLILDDTYNNDLPGLRTAMDYLHQQPLTGRTVILSDILQSGKPDWSLYSEVNELLVKHQINRLIGIGKAISKAEFTIPFAPFETVNDFLQDAPEFANETILVKGARDYELERIVAYLEEKNHGTVLEVNFEAILHNLNVYRTLLKPNVRLMVMVKAFAYGVGVEETASLLQYHHVDYLGVAFLDEAINLRRKGIQLPIMIMNVDWNNFPLLETFRVEPEIYSVPMLHRLLQECKNPPPIHLKIETGMNRLGFSTDQLDALIGLLKANPALKVAGIFTHLSCADDPAEDDYTRMQAQLFETAYARLSNALGYRPIKHAINSAGIVRWPALQYDMVRLGIGLYGYDSSEILQELRTISQLKTTVSHVKKVKKGDSIGYSRKGQANENCEIATIAIGYADGYRRCFGNGKGYVSIHGHHAPTVGNICMDMTMIDVTGLQVAPGDEVIVFGKDPAITDLSNWAETIPYEILTSVSPRVKRVFVSE